MIVSYIHPADQIVMFMQRIYDKGLTTTSGGNLSIRDAQGNIWITPAGIDKGTLTRRDIICVTPTGGVIGPHRPSSELPFHAGVYRRRPDLRAVLHAHPPALVSFSILRRLPSLDLMPTVRKLCPELQMAAYAVPGSEKLGENISACFAEGCDCVLLENHGVCVGAPDLFTAFQRFETLNHTAQLELLASRLGNVKTLAPEDYRRSNTQVHLTMEEFQPADRTAEELKMKIGCVFPRPEEQTVEIKGRCLMTGLPRVFSVSSSEMIEAFEEVSSRILEAIHGVLERTPPELVADISTNGIVMTGGGSLVWGFDKLIESHTGIETHVADDAISCVAYGTGKSLDSLDQMQDGTMNLSRRKQMNY